MSPSGFPNYPTSLHNECVPYYYGAHDDICFHPVQHLFRLFGVNRLIPAVLSVILPHHHHMVNNIADEDELAYLREKRKREIEVEMGAMVHSPSGSPVAVKEVTDMNLVDLVQAHPYLVVDCWAEWCGPCMTIAPVIEELASEFMDVVTFGKCDADMNPGVMQTFQISAIPTLLLFAGGSLAGRLTGAYPKESIRASLMRTFGL